MKAVVFRVESYAECAEGVFALTSAHWQEVANYTDQIPLAPDHARYRELDALGALHLVIARDGATGAVCGYTVHTLHWHLHYQTSMTAQNDVFYLHPAYRQGLTGLRMLRFALAKLAELGVQRQVLSIKIPRPGANHAADLTPLMRRLGAVATETVYTTLLDRKG